MLIRHAVAGLPSRRTRTGSGLRHPGFKAFARRALTRTNGLMPWSLISAVKRIVLDMGSFDLRHRPAGQLVRLVRHVPGADPILDAKRHDAVEDTVARENYPRLAVDCRGMYLQAA